MNIKSVTNPLQLDVVDRIRETNASVKSDETQEREGDGRQAQGDDAKKRHLNDTEIFECLEILKKIKGVQDNHLSVELVIEDNIKKIVIKDQSGQVVKRIAESHFYQILDNKNQPSAKGGLLSRAA